MSNSALHCGHYKRPHAEAHDDLVFGNRREALRHASCSVEIGASMLLTETAARASDG